MNKVKIEVILFTVMIGVIIGGVTYLLFLFNYQPEHTRDSNTYGFFLTESLLIAGLFMWLTYMFFTAKTITLEKGDCLVENDRLVDIPQKVTLWEGDSFLKGKRIIKNEVFRCFQVHMKISPITNNPKVRNLIYWVTISVKDRQKFYDIFLKSSKNIEPSNIIRKSCYEFNEQFSIELANLYNPLDEIQQKRFSEMFFGFLLPIIKELDAGLEIRAVEFSL